MIDAAFAHLWQSTLFAALAALLTLAFQKNRASIRYCIWLAASVKFLIPVSPLVALVHDMAWNTDSMQLVSRSPMLTDLMAGGATISAAVMVPLATSQSAGMSITTILLVLWACGATAAFSWWLVRWRRLRAVLRAATQVQFDAPIPVRSSPLLLEPGLFGIFRPVIVLPEKIVPALNPRQLKAVLGHELTHWRRHDNLTAALHMVVEALFWFHPLVWWLGRRLVIEREHACDEAVIGSLCDRQAYAEAILKICQGYAPQPLRCVSGVAGGDLKRRIAMIMTAPVGGRLRIAKRLLLAGVTCAAMLIPVAAGIVGSWRAAAGELNEGLGAFDRGDYQSALGRLRPLADQGNAAAQDRLGQMYDRGLGVVRDYVQAVAWYRRAAMQGDAAGQQDLSQMYAQGHGVPVDPLAAALWARQGLLHMMEGPTCEPKLMFETQGADQVAPLQAAAERDDPQAAVLLGSYYEIGVPEKNVDHVKALRWISQSAKQGNAKGEAALASMYLAGFAAPPNDSAAVTLMRQAAEQGLERAQCALGVMYERGLGVAKDHIQTARWYRGLVLSTDHNGLVQDWARTKVAAMYETGDGLGRDDDEAVSWLRRAADNGFPFAETRLGIRFATGKASERDYSAAAKLLESAAKKGVPAAQIVLGNLYAEGHGVSPNTAVAYKWFDLAARYSTSPTERDEAKKDRDRISAGMSRQDIALAERLVDRWLPADSVGDHIHAGGDM
jgi:TPR repeat protein/beta-lactamase regulating signal transducer with metallopeptidase domain